MSLLCCLFNHILPWNKYHRVSFQRVIHPYFIVEHDTSSTTRIYLWVFYPGTHNFFVRYLKDYSHSSEYHFNFVPPNFGKIDSVSDTSPHFFQFCSQISWAFLQTNKTMKVTVSLILWWVPQMNNTPLPFFSYFLQVLLPWVRDNPCKTSFNIL